MKVVFLLFSCLTEKIEFMLLCLYIKYFSVERDFFFLGWWAGEIRRHKLERKLLSCVVYDHISTWCSHFVFGRSSTSI